MKSRQSRTGGPPRGGIRTRHAALPRAPALRALAAVAAGGGMREGMGRTARGPGTAARSQSTPPATVWRGIEDTLELRKLAARARHALAGHCRLAAVLRAGRRVLRRAPARRRPPRNWPPCEDQIRRLSTGASELLGDNQELSLHVRRRCTTLPPGKALRAVGAAGAVATRYRWDCCRSRGEHHRVLSAAQRAGAGGAKQTRRQPRARRRLADRRCLPARCCTLQPSNRPEIRLGRHHR